MNAYVLALHTHPWLLPVVEASLLGLEGGATTGASSLARGLRAPTGKPVSTDEALIALNALCDLGVMERAGLRYRFNKDRFSATDELRKSMQQALHILSEHTSSTSQEVQLCVSLPPSLSSVAEHVIRESSTDLRSSLFDVIANAKESLILASPFWDADTTAEMISLVRKKLDAGVCVSILGRFLHDLPAKVSTELRRVANTPACSILSWFEGTGSDTETFHFKAVSADRGARAYMGSANMTVSSLRSRMELGVILTGPAAAQLDRILRVVITMASPIRI
jgi:phosphatidylserine/phosphatidylglycerophosphate/cardiolipin synthase-like enzyme